MSEWFSKRHGFASVDEAEISVRADAPQALQEYLTHLVYECGLNPSDLRQLICKDLKALPNKQNWSERPNIHEENAQMLGECKWYVVYEAIESVVDCLGERIYDSDVYQHFIDQLNKFYVEHGIGWKLLDVRVEIRDSRFGVV